jgi:hypothetical protein
MFSHNITFKVPDRFNPKKAEWGQEGLCSTCTHALPSLDGHLCKRHMQTRLPGDKGFYSCGFVLAPEPVKRKASKKARA